MSVADSIRLAAWSNKPLNRPRPLERPRWSYRGNKQRWKLGGAFYMAQEIAAQLPAGVRLLDVGCGRGYITQHLSGLLGAPAEGVDVLESVETPIVYKRFDGVQLPHGDASFGAMLCAYVLHHAADCRALLRDMARVLEPGGTLVVYEDLPETAWDRWLCRRHHLAWLDRCGPSTFYRAREWERIFVEAGFELRLSVPLSRLRDLTHPVARQFFVLGR